MSDLIDRQAALKICRKYCWEEIEKLPSAQPEPEKGRWIDMDDHVLCSLCGAAHYGVDKNYCPNCGADMRKES